MPQWWFQWWSWIFGRLPKLPPIKTQVNIDTISKWHWFHPCHWLHFGNIKHSVVPILWNEQKQKQSVFLVCLVVSVKLAWKFEKFFWLFWKSKASNPAKFMQWKNPRWSEIFIFLVQISVLILCMHLPLGRSEPALMLDGPTTAPSQNAREPTQNCTISLFIFEIWRTFQRFLQHPQNRHCVGCLEQLACQHFLRQKLHQNKHPSLFSHTAKLCTIGTNPL